MLVSPKKGTRTNGFHCPSWHTDFQYCTYESNTAWLMVSTKNVVVNVNQPPKTFCGYTTDFCNHQLAIAAICSVSPSVLILCPKQVSPNLNCEDSWKQQQCDSKELTHPKRFPFCRKVTRQTSQDISISKICFLFRDNSTCSTCWIWHRWFQPSFAGTETLGSSFELLLVDIRVHSGQNL